MPLIFTEEGEEKQVLDLDQIRKDRETASAKQAVEAEKKVEEGIVVDEKPVVVTDEKPAVVVDEKIVVADEKQVVVVDDKNKPAVVVEQPKNTDINSITIDDEGQKVTVAEYQKKYEVAKAQLKAIAEDVFLAKFVDFKLKGGDPQVYLDSQGRDWSKPSDLTLLKNEFFASEKVAGLDEEASQELFERELSEKYSASADGTYDDDNSKTARVGKQLMKRDAEKVRALKIAEQKNFEVPKPAEKKSVVEYDPAKERERLMQKDEIKNFIAGKKVKISDTEFSFEVEDTESIIGMMTDVRGFWSLFNKPDGSLDYGRLTKALAFCKNPSKYDNDVLALGKTLGQEALIAEKKNIQGIKQVNQENSVVSASGGKPTTAAEKEEFIRQIKLQNPRN